MMGILKLLCPIAPLCHAIIQQGGTCYFVGGVVRDYVLGRIIKDIDIEVHNLSLNLLEKILADFGVVKLVGKKFGVLRVGSYDVDWSLPRKDSKGRKPEVMLDPFLTLEQAARRRDVTMNAMAIDIATIIQHCDTRQNNSEKKLEDIVIDPYGGLLDIKKNQLRAVDVELFIEDPLRFFRVMQFIGRFNMMPDKELSNLCATMSLWDQAQEGPLALERIQDEFKKLFIQSDNPSRGIFWLTDINRLDEILPPLHQLLIRVGVQQYRDILHRCDVIAQC